jgi:hypothetical protein
MRVQRIVGAGQSDVTGRCRGRLGLVSLVAYTEGSQAYLMAHFQKLAPVQATTVTERHGTEKGVWLLELLPLIGTVLMLRWRVLGRWLGVESIESGVRELSANLAQDFGRVPLPYSNQKRQG